MYYSVVYRGNQQRPLSVLREVCITLLSVVYRGNQQRTLSVLREVCITLLCIEGISRGLLVFLEKYVLLCCVYTANFATHVKHMLDNKYVFHMFNICITYIP